MDVIRNIATEPHEFYVNFRLEFLPREAHHEMSWLCGAVSIVEPARETTLRATLAGLPNATNTAIASIAVRPTPPAQ